MADHNQATSIQAFHYGHRGGLGFCAFDLMVSERNLDWPELKDALARFAVPSVPVLHEGPFDVATMKACANGRTTFDDTHIREGIVLRPMRERFDERIGRVVLKYVSDEFLLDERKSVTAGEAGPLAGRGRSATSDFPAARARRGRSQGRSRPPA